MTGPKAFARLTLIALLVGGLGAATAILVLPQLRWRATVVLLKARGGLPDMSWGELLPMLHPDAPIYLEPLVENPNPHQVITNPYRSAEDLSEGQGLFRSTCTACHGAQGTGGGGGPDIVSAPLRHGASDWALYRTITRGVPGTAMPEHDLPPPEVWRIIAHLRALQGSVGAVPRDRAAATQVEIRAVAGEELDSPPNGEWLTYSGHYASHRHSPLSQVTSANVGALEVSWLLQLPASDYPIETSPLVVDGVMFLTVPPQQVLAVDLRTRALLWSWERELPDRIDACCELVNRGLALLGNSLFLGTLDAHLIAFDARTGEVFWDVEVADHQDGYSITSAPLVAAGLVITGVAGGEFGVRGFLDAYDPSTGERVWRFMTIPEPGDPGSETWTGDAWRTGGAPTWLTGSFDPDLELLYWGVGNPSPDFQGDARPGDNLFSSSVLALEVATGRLRWHFQFTPHDEHDWDAAQIPILADLDVEGTRRRALLWANRNAFYYVLDRETGEFLGARAFATQTWADSIDARGRPWTRPEARPSRGGTLVYPGVVGATNWWPPSYDPVRELVYVPTLERPSVFFSGEVPDRRPGENFLGSAAQGIVDGPYFTAVRALRATSGELIWEYRHAPRTGGDDYRAGGLLSTAGGVLFGGDGTLFFALDSATGGELWKFDAGGPVHAPAITYALDGRQFVAVVAGKTLIAFSLDEG
ncbi:MAG: PQQ-dependent dehydrogenase, methanol/ethanol family [Gemmatimonadota bacterium]